MKIYFLKQPSLILLFLLLITPILSQEKILVPEGISYSLEREYLSKIASSEVIRLLNEKTYLKKLNPDIRDDKTEYIHLFIYLSEKPTFSQINILEQNGIKILSETWIPPLQNHPYGFVLAKVPLDKVNTLLSNNFIIKIGSAENEFVPNNNLGTASINANLVWNAGYTGTGVKVAVLDSGLDTEPTNSDLPGTIQKRDYSNFPIVDNNVENTVTGHGTHVTGSVLGRGVLSASNTINGSGPYKGSAPNADLVFLKIGSDATGSASSAAIIAAIQSAVDTFSADIITMSYGGWYDHHDGSSAEEQTVDWAFSQGVPVFLSAGNSGSAGRHYSGTVNANSETGFIRVNVTGAGANNTALYFNLVWADGENRNNLTLKYYNSSQNELTNIVRLTTTESSRGTESHYSYYNQYLPLGNGTYYLKVVNPSGINQPFHIYDVWGARVTFNNPDPFYTVGQPSTADNCFSVGAYTSRISWTASNGNNYSFSGAGSLNDIAPFSSRGPRIDGTIKPDISVPGTAIISIRDRDVYTSSDQLWVDNDGISGGSANYYVMQGTSMATPLAAGSAALILQKFPGVSPQQVYDAIKNTASTDAFTGSVPNGTWGYGKLNISSAIDYEALPVELSAFNARILKTGGVQLSWRTETEVSNYGFDILRSAENENWKVLGFVEGYGSSNSPKEYSFTDNSVLFGKYFYRLKQINTDGSFEYSNIIEIVLGKIPDRFVLEHNYPNPFNPVTKIDYQIPDLSDIKLELYSITGEKVLEIAEVEKEPGYHTLTIDMNRTGKDVSSGIYFYRFILQEKQTGSVAVYNRKIIFLK
jgi:subtilisin family serine protease